MPVSTCDGDAYLRGIGAEMAAEMTEIGTCGAMPGGDIDAEAMAMLAESMDSIHEDMRTYMTEIRQANVLRAALRERIQQWNELRQGRELQNAPNDNEHVRVRIPDGLLAGARPALDADGRPCFFGGKPIGDDRVPGGVAGPGERFVSRAAVDKEIEHLRDQIDSLNGATEIANLRLQSLLSRKQQIVTAVSNILSRSHESAMAPVRNMKG